MKKAFDQTVRGIKREVNKNVLKVPSIEQKVLDATSNEPWGPHGLLLADIAQATRNYHEHQMIMAVLWKRINDTGKNWRHVYKALTVLEYLVAHGSERVIDEIREHAYQISTLSDFQYIDSSGRDQGNNVRRKSQSIVVLVNDKERIQEVRQKAAANRDKYHNTSMGNQPGSYSSPGRYGDDRYDGRYVNRDSDRNGYGRETDMGYKDDDRYARYGDSYGREGDKNSRDYEERFGRDGYRDDDYRGSGQSTTSYNNGSRNGSADLDKDRAYEEDGQYASRGSGAKTGDHSPDESSLGKRLDRKYSEQNLDAPPSYEDAVNAKHSPTSSERDGESSLDAPRASSPPSGVSTSHPTIAAGPQPASDFSPAQASTLSTAPDSNKEVDDFDEFDPRGSFSAAPTTTNGIAPATPADMGIDLLGSLSDSFSSNSLALVPASQPTIIPEAPASANVSSGPTFTATSSTNQPFDDPFGDGPFKAVLSVGGAPAQQQLSTPTSSFNPHSSQSFDIQHSAPQMAGTEFGSTCNDSSHMPSVPSGVQPPPDLQSVQQDLATFNQDVDILADILPPSISSSAVDTQSGYPLPANQSVNDTVLPQAHQPLHSGLPSLTGQNAPQNSFQAQYSGLPAQLGGPSSQRGYPLPYMALNFSAQSGQSSQMGFHSQSGQPAYIFEIPSQMGSSQVGLQFPFGGPSVQPNPPNPNLYGIPGVANIIPTGSSGPIAQHNFHSQINSAVPAASQLGPQAPQVRPDITLAPVSTTTGSSAVVSQPAKDKFETKSTVWADTLSRGLVNLNISGSKTNPLADIGVDFDAINRKEKRMEKPTTAAVTSTVTMGKAMGSGSGMGRTGASVLRPPPNPMIGSGGNMNIGGGPGAGMSMGGGYGVNQPMGMGMGMNMGMGQGIHMQQHAGFPPGSTMPGGYNPMMGTSNYSQRPYGGGQ